MPYNLMHGDVDIEESLFIYFLSRFYQKDDLLLVGEPKKRDFSIFYPERWAFLWPAFPSIIEPCR
jgi:hypothetical protein